MPDQTDALRIAVIGAGNVGGALARAFAGLGHAITLGVRDPDAERVRALAANTNAQLTLPSDAAQRADLVVLAVPGSVSVEAAASLGDLTGTILLDTTNPVGPGLLPPPGDGRSLAERVARAAPGARVVKAFHTLAAEHMGYGQLGGRRIALFLCGDDPDANGTVAGLASDLGFEPVDVGGLDRARLTEPMALVWITLATRQGVGRDVAFGLLRPDAQA